MQLRDRVRRAAKRLGSTRLWERYRSLRNKTVAILRSAFFESLAAGLSSAKAFWKAHRMLTQDRQSVPSCVAKGSVSATTPMEQSELFNCHFSSCFAEKSQPLLPSEFEES